MWFSTSNLKHGAYFIAATHGIYYLAETLLTSFHFMTDTRYRNWYYAFIMMISVLSIIFQYILFDGTRKGIPRQLEIWIKLSIFVSVPYWIILLLFHTINLSVYAIFADAIAIVIVLACIKFVWLFHVEVKSRVIAASASVSIP